MKIGFGTWALGGETTLGGKPIGWGPTDENTSLTALQIALEQGITFFDTADIYGAGRAETLLGKAISNSQYDVNICTKCGNREDNNGKAFQDFSPEWITTSLEGSLRRLKREQVEILLLHGPPIEFHFSDELRICLDELLKSGKLGAYGVSVKNVSSAERVLEANFGTVIEGIYNLLDRRMEEAVLPELILRKKIFISRMPLASGFLSLEKDFNFPQSDFRHHLPESDREWRIQSVNRLKSLLKDGESLSELALRFCLSQPGINFVIPGMRNPEQVLANLEASKLGPLSSPIIQQIKQIILQTFSGW
jgi:aryl-alcohol dehydrogenase-like predicted oxidoreductase